MTYFVCDINGFVGDLATTRGLEELILALGREGVYRDLFDDGCTEDLEALIKALESESSPDTFVNSTIKNLFSLAKKCSDIIIITDGAESASNEFSHGGSGSGNWGHAGRPGEVGGSASGGGGSATGGATGSAAPGAFDIDKWRGMDMNTRRAEWAKLSLAERDRLADAPASIMRREADLNANLDDWKDSGNIYQDVRDRVSSASDDITFESQVRITETIGDLEAVLGRTGMDEDQVGLICKVATDTLLAQEMETYNRQLGDHGIAHIQGDIGRSMDIIGVVPGVDTSEQVAEIYLAGIFHDTGYLTEPSQVFLDEGHPRWSMQNYTENVAPFLREAGVPEQSIMNVATIIRNHDGTDINWSEDPVGSAFRVADNTALFDEDKMPPAFKYVPENLDVLVDIEKGAIGLDEGKEKMRENIRAKDTLTTTQKIRLEKAVDESTAYTPKATLGMLGGKIEGVTWNEDHVSIALRPDDSYTRLQEVADVGQRQFGKFAESYGQDPEQFKSSLDFKFKDKAGKTLLEGTIVRGLKNITITLGGAGSGNFGHGGRPGEVGGSAPGGGGASGDKVDWSENRKFGGTLAEQGIKSFANVGDKGYEIAAKVAAEAHHAMPMENVDFGRQAFASSLALREYQSDGYENKNTALRRGEYARGVDYIDKDIENAPKIPEGTVMWRGVGRESGEKLAGLKPGDICEDKAFQSHSLSPWQAEVFTHTWGDAPGLVDGANETIIMAIAGKDTKGIYLGGITENQTVAHEREVLVKRGTKWKVVETEVIKHRDPDPLMRRNVYIVKVVPA
jgi:hypothetical protein